MNDYISPSLTLDELEPKFDRTPVEPGVYTMIVKGEPKVKTSKAGNRYLNIQLAHTGDNAKKGSIFDMVMLEGTATNSKTGAAINLAVQFGRLALALGFSKEDLASGAVGWRARAAETEEETKRGVPVEIAFKGDPIQLAGKEVIAKLAIETIGFGSRTGEKQNVVASYLAPKTA